MLLRRKTVRQHRLCRASGHLVFVLWITSVDHAAAAARCTHACGQVAITEAGNGRECTVFVPADASVDAVKPVDNRAPSPAEADGTRVLYLDFEGGVVQVATTSFAPFDDDGFVVVPPFVDSLRRAYPTLDPDETRSAILDRVRAEYFPFGAVVTDDLIQALAAGEGHFERLYVGGGVEMFGRPEAGITTATIGIAEVDPGDENADNIGFVLVENFRHNLSTADLAGPLMGVVAAHEFGHELGLDHIENEAARMFFRVDMNAAELTKTWLSGRVDGSARDYQDSPFRLGRTAGVSMEAFPTDLTPDDLADNFFHAQAAPDIEPPTPIAPISLSGRIDGPGDVDVIRFVRSADGPLTVTLTPSETLTGLVALLTEDGTVLDVRQALQAGHSVELSFPIVFPNIYYVYVNGKDGTSQGTYALQLCASANDPPRVRSATVNGGSHQRSRVTHLEVLFDVDVEVNLDAVELIHLGANAPEEPDVPVDPAVVTVSYSRVDRAIDVEFDASLRDGFYELRVGDDGVIDCAGNRLDGDGDGVEGPDYAFAFHQFAGDLDGDTDVDLADFLVFQRCATDADDAECVGADLDVDGDVDLSDHVAMQSVFTGSGSRPGPGDIVGTNVLAGEAALSEVTIDVNPTDPRNQIIVGHSPDLIALNTFYTLDGGATWTLVPLGDADDGLVSLERFDPTVAFDNDGIVYVGYGATTGSPDAVTVIVAKSTDGGQSYHQFTRVATAPHVDEIKAHDKWHLATGPDPTQQFRHLVCIAWTRNVMEETGIDQQIVVSCSWDGAETFSTPVIVNDRSITGTRRGHRFADPAIGPNGEVYIAWHDVLGTAVMMDVSFDGGVTFGPDRLVTRSTVGFLTAIEAQRDRGISVGPAIDVDRSGGPFDGRAYVTYLGYGASGWPNTDIMVRSSDDAGTTWTEATRVNDDRLPKSQFLPWLDVDQRSGVVGVVWYDARNDPGNAKVEVFFAASDDGGAGFGENVLVSDAPSDMSRNNVDRYLGNFLEYIGLALFDCVAYPVWSDNSRDPADLDYMTDRIAIDSPLCAPVR